MQIVNKLMMLSINVGDMPKAKACYADKLGLKVMTDSIHRPSGGEESHAGAWFAQRCESIERVIV